MAITLPRRVAIVQSAYLPWRGYFDLIRQADVFVFLDGVQFAPRTWRTRNYIKAATGNRLRLSVPVRRKHRLIKDVELSTSQPWIRKHQRSIEHAYARAPYRHEIVSMLGKSYASPPQYLYQLNRKLIRVLWDYATGGQQKLFLGDEEFDLPNGICANERLIAICESLEATEYLSGPSAKDYINTDKWRACGIAVRYMDYKYSRYPQLHGAFEQNVSILDPLMYYGPGSLAWILKRQNEVANTEDENIEPLHASAAG